jgi:hypothetical protein
VIEEVSGLTREDDDGIRTVLIESFASQIDDLIHEECFIDSLKKAPGLAAEMLKEYLNRKSPGYTQSIL